MPVNTLPRRCNLPTCPLCTTTEQSDRIHPCTDETPSSPEPTNCCPCFARFLAGYHFPPADTQFPPQLLATLYTLAIGNFNATEGKWIGRLNDFDGDKIDDLEVYFERTEGTCYLVLWCPTLGFDTGTEQKWELAETEEECRTLRFSITLGDGSTIVIAGATVDESVEGFCAVACCDPLKCFTIEVTGTVRIKNELTGDTVSSDTFTAPVVLNVFDFSIWSQLAEDFNDNRAFPPSPCNAWGTGVSDLVTVTDTGGNTTQFQVGILAILYGNALYVTTDGLLSEDIYEIDPPIGPAATCSGVTISRIATNRVWLPYCCYPPGGRYEVDLDAATALGVDDSCVKQPTPCNGAPTCLSFFIRGVTNDDCEDCNQVNQPVYLTRQPGTCTYYGPKWTSGICLAVYSASYARWVAVVDEDDSSIVMQLVLFDGSDDPIAVLATYTAAAGDTYPRAMTFDSATEDCDNWPASLTIYNCRRFNVGACCKTAESAEGASVCEELLEEECEAANGLFLGVNTRCAYDGCVSCDYPGDCSTRCETYRLRFFLSTPSGCGGFFPTIDFTDILLTRDGTSGECRWLGSAEDGAWTFELLMDDSTDPPTWTLNADYIPAATTTIDMTATSPHGFCTATNAAFTIDSFVSEYCDGDPPAAYSILLEIGDDCPELQP